MALVTTGAITEPVPGEPGDSITFHKVSWWVRAEASKVKIRAAIDHTKDAGPDLVRLWKELEDAKESGDAEKADAVAELEKGVEEEDDPWDPAGYDTATILEACVDEWSYVDDSGKKIPVTPETLKDLDAPTTDWLMQRIFEITRPPSDEEKKDD